MNLQELKNIIKKEVREAVREELKELLVEAVRVASTPEQTHRKDNYPRNTIGIGTHTLPIEKEENPSSIKEALKQTRRSMLKEDFYNIMGDPRQTLEQSFSFSSKDVGSSFKPDLANLPGDSRGFNAPLTGNEPGIDISNLSFVKNASNVLQASYQKDKMRQSENTL